MDFSVNILYRDRCINKYVPIVKIIIDEHLNIRFCSIESEMRRIDEKQVPGRGSKLVKEKNKNEYELPSLGKFS